MKHKPEGTHYCCDSRLKKEHGASKCCECVPHEGCDYDKPSPEQWEQKFNAARGIYGEFAVLNEEIEK